MNNIPLTKLQKEIMEEFYQIQPTKLYLTKQKEIFYGKKQHEEVEILILKK